ncbi:hypothetical protein SEVIR_9G064550v4 [Setaria viridis]
MPRRPKRTETCKATSRACRLQRCCPAARLAASAHEQQASAQQPSQRNNQSRCSLQLAASPGVRAMGGCGERGDPEAPSGISDSPVDCAGTHASSQAEITSGIATSPAAMTAAPNVCK